MEKQIRYIQDDTGLNYSNIIENEHHHLEDRRFKCMVLVHGAFFAETIVIKQKGTNYQLVHNKDYVFSDIDIEASERTGQPVACVIIIINHKLGRDFIVKYRSAGIPLGSLNERTVALLEAPGTGLLSDSYHDVRQKPTEFEPAFHYHFISSIQKMEYLLFFIEKIRIAILYDITAPFREYMQTVEKIIQGLTNKANDELETQIEIGFETFKQSITKLSIGVDKVPNLPLITSRDALDISLDKLHLANPEGLLALKAFIHFKNGLYNIYLGSDLTRLDRSEGTVVTPKLDILLNLMVGATILFDSYSENVNAGIQFDRLAYPTIKRSNSHFSIKKLSNINNENSCLLLAIEIETSIVFIGKLTKTNVGNLIVWKDIKEPPDIKLSTLSIQKHMSDWDNPHKDTKASVELNFMENLPIASEFDILTDSIARKYITWRQLSKFMRRFLLKQRPNKTEQLLTADENAMRNFSIIFSPCGQTCGVNDCAVIGQPIAPTTTQPPGPSDAIGIYEDEGFSNSIDAFEYNNHREIWDYDDADMFMQSHPFYYNSDGSRDTTKPAPGSDLQDWKHANYIMNLNFTDSLRADEVEDFINNYESEMPNKSVVIFRVFNSDKPTTDIFFRVEFYILASSPPIQPRRLSEFDYDRCEKFSVFSNVDPNQTSPYYGSIRNEQFRLKAERIGSWNGGSQIGQLSFNCNSLVDFELTRDEKTGEIIDYFPNPRAGQVHKIRMRVIETSEAVNYDESDTSKDLGVLGSIDFVLASTIIYYPEGEGSRLRYHQLDSILNITPANFSNSVSHEVCNPRSHDGSIITSPPNSNTTSVTPTTTTTSVAPTSTTRAPTTSTPVTTKIVNITNAPITTTTTTRAPTTTTTRPPTTTTTTTTSTTTNTPTTTSTSTTTVKPTSTTFTPTTVKPITSSTTSSAPVPIVLKLNPISPRNATWLGDTFCYGENIHFLVEGISPGTHLYWEVTDKNHNSLVVSGTNYYATRGYTGYQTSTFIFTVDLANFTHLFPLDAISVVVRFGSHTGPIVGYGPVIKIYNPGHGRILNDYDYIFINNDTTANKLATRIQTDIPSGLNLIGKYPGSGYMETGLSGNNFFAWGKNKLHNESVAQEKYLLNLVELRNATGLSKFSFNAYSLHESQTTANNAPVKVTFTCYKGGQLVTQSGSNLKVVQNALTVAEEVFMVMPGQNVDSSLSRPFDHLYLASINDNALSLNGTVPPKTTIPQ